FRCSVCSPRRSTRKSGRASRGERLDARQLEAQRIALRFHLAEGRERADRSDEPADREVLGRSTFHRSIDLLTWGTRFGCLTRTKTTIPENYVARCAAARQILASARTVAVELGLLPVPPVEAADAELGDVDAVEAA